MIVSTGMQSKFVYILVHYLNYLFNQSNLYKVLCSIDFKKALMYCGVDKEFTSVRQSQEAEAASNYGNEPQHRNCLPKKGRI